MVQRQQLRWFYVRYRMNDAEHVVHILDHNQEHIERYLLSFPSAKIEHVELFQPPVAGNRLVRRNRDDHTG